MTELALERWADEMFPTELAQDAPAPASSALPEEGDAPTIPETEAPGSTPPLAADGRPEVANEGESKRTAGNGSVTE